jgi:hypothetical protein
MTLIFFLILFAFPKLQMIQKIVSQLHCQQKRMNRQNSDWSRHGHEKSQCGDQRSGLLATPTRVGKFYPCPVFNPGLNRVGQNSKNPVTVGKAGQNVIKF